MLDNEWNELHQVMKTSRVEMEAVHWHVNQNWHLKWALLILLNLK